MESSYKSTTCEDEEDECRVQRWLPGDICLKVRAPRNWRILVTSMQPASKTTMPLVMLSKQKGTIILRFDKIRHKGNTTILKDKLFETRRHRLSQDESVYAYASFPYGWCEEREALVRAAGIGRDEWEWCRRPPDMVLGQDGPQPLTPAAMGSNVSHHSGKGMGRRATSSGNLCHGAKLLAPGVGRFFNPCGTGSVSPRDRNKLCGSLPTQLDEKGYGGNNNYGDIYGLGQMSSPAGNDVSLLLCDPEKDESPADTHTSTPSLAHFPFITKDSIFEVVIEKGSRGLGMSVYGGTDSDSDDSHPGLVRIKRVFPHEPAWLSGALHTHDILLYANGTPLTGLTNYEALEVLRSTGNPVHLVVCRPCSSSPQADPTPAPSRQTSLRISPVYNLNNYDTYGEFDITLEKVNGSLGFTLRKSDDTVLGHYVRALVREPAISDGRVQPGDKIVAVNGLDISPLSHEEAVQMLRRCGSTVCLRLYRDAAQTPVTALSPTEPQRRLVLRQEAVEMLSHLAVQRQSPGESSPRRRRLDRSDHSRAHASDAHSFEQCLTDGPGIDEDTLERHKFVLMDMNDEPASLPAIGTRDLRAHNPLYQSDHSPAFCTHNPLYQSSHSPSPPSPNTSESHVGPHGLLKWKGIVFSPEDGLSDSKDNTLYPELSTPEDGEVLLVELSKGWNSRLGFSLQGSPSGTFISAIYADSVAAKDGRLQIGDKVLMINDEKIRGMATSEVIDLLRKIRGAIAITVLRNRTPSRPSSPSAAPMQIIQ